MVNGDIFGKVKQSNSSDVDSCQCCVEFLGSLGSKTENERCAVWLRQKGRRSI